MKDSCAESLDCSNDYLEHLSWCWRCLHNFGVDVCHLHVTVGSSMAQYLANEGQFTRLRQFISSLSVDEYSVLYGEEQFTTAMIRLHVAEGNYLDALCLLKNGRFPNKDESLVQIWYDIHYKLAEIGRGHPLSSLQRFRVRKSHPPPPSICVAGQTLPPRQSVCAATPMLRAWLNKHLDRPYPSREEMEDLVSKTQMPARQIRAWFANARRSLHKSRRKGRPTGRAAIA